MELWIFTWLKWSMTLLLLVPSFLFLFIHFNSIHPLLLLLSQNTFLHISFFLHMAHWIPFNPILLNSQPHKFYISSPLPLFFLPATLLYHSFSPSILKTNYCKSNVIYFSTIFNIQFNHQVTNNSLSSLKYVTYKYNSN
jgi:hypothetical protein